jgi:glycerol-1-phosphate dehydrogenase [NAD(P)+]
MELSELLRGKENCECGMSHYCPIKYLVIEEGALNKIPELVSEYSSILLVADVNTYRVCGEATEKLIKDKIESTLIYEGEGVLVPDEKAIDALQAKVTDKTDLIVGVGSGVINDLCKQVSFANKLPYYIVATAPSMDGYASKGSALILGGMKVTLNADVPTAIIADVDVIKNAPFDMIQAGYGDIIGKFSCLNDWKLSHVVNGEYICDYVYNATLDTTKETLELASKLTERDPEAVCALMKALVTVGILMAYVGNSRPASGSEHHLSHYFEIVGILNNEPYFPHGVDVCYSAIETCKLREQVLAIKNINELEYSFDKAAYEADIKRIYTSIADEIFALQNKMGWYDVDRVKTYKAKWDEVCAVLSECPTSAEMLEYVERVGLKYDEFVKLYGEKKIADGVRFAKDLKDRYTVLWTLFELVK